MEPFQLRPVCPKCKNDRWHRVFHSVGLCAAVWCVQKHEADFITMRCEACSYRFTMMPADAGEGVT